MLMSMIRATKGDIMFYPFVALIIISDSLKTVRKSVSIYETIIVTTVPDETLKHMPDTCEGCPY